MINLRIASNTMIQGRRSLMIVSWIVLHWCPARYWFRDHRSVLFVTAFTVDDSTVNYRHNRMYVKEFLIRDCHIILVQDNKIRQLPRNDSSFFVFVILKPCASYCIQFERFFPRQSTFTATAEALGCAGC